jgi:hypothetical protein
MNKNTQRTHRVTSFAGVTLTVQRLYARWTPGLSKPSGFLMNLSVTAGYMGRAMSGLKISARLPGKQMF